MTYHTGDSFMDQWLNSQIRCDKNRLNWSLQVLHACTESSAELLYRSELFHWEEMLQCVLTNVGPVTIIKEMD